MVGLFFRKKEESKKEELEKIKKNLEKEALPPQTAPTEKQQEERAAEHRAEEEHIAQPGRAATLEPAVLEPQAVTASLFIKLEKYEEIIRRLENVKNLVSEIREILKIGDEIERLRRESISLLVANVRELSRIISLIDRDLLRPTSHVLESEHTEAGEIGDLEFHLQELKRQIDELKRTL